MKNAILSLILAAVAAGGCARIQKDLGTPLPYEAFEALDEGVHYSQVLEALGPPSRVSALPAGWVFLYEYLQVDERQWGFIFPGKIGKYFKAVYAQTAASADVMVFSFDQEGLMQAGSAGRLDIDPGGGFALSIIFKVKSLSDTDQYKVSQQGVLEWGKAMTQPLPVTLNAGQNLDSGDKGLESVGLETHVGQRTLEMGRGY